MLLRPTFASIIAMGLAISACTTDANNKSSQSDLKAPSAPSAPLASAWDGSGEHPATSLSEAPFTLAEMGQFSEPWALRFIPASNLVLITEKSGKLKLWQEGGPIRDVAGVPSVNDAGQGGLGDVILSPDFASSGIIYLSWVEAGTGDVSGSVVGKAKLVQGDSPRIEAMQIIWRQSPKVSSNGHFSHRLIFSPDGKYLFIGSGERQKFTPAQEMSGNLGKILRLHPDGTIPADNPFADQGGIAAQIWTLGHRNILGLAFDRSGGLWNQEMGPKGGDEINLVIKGKNYGYPLVSNGDHYDGRPIPNHDTRPEFTAPKLWWNPVVSPGGLAFYDGDIFPQWKNSLFVGALSGEGLVRASIHGENLSKADRWDLGMRIRDVAVREDGSIWIISDGKNGKLMKLEPKS